MKVKSFRFQVCGMGKISIMKSAISATKRANTYKLHVSFHVP